MLTKKRSAVPFEQAVRMARSRGILTLASGIGKDEESFEAFVDGLARDVRSEAVQQEPGSKPRQGRYITDHLSCPDSVDKLYADILDSLALAGQALD